MKIHKCLQGSDEWMKCRKGKLTGSNAQAIQAQGDGLKSYVVQVMSNYYASVRDDTYTNSDMDRGTELEPLARAEYSRVNKVKVKEVGFIEMNKYVGVSPDGLVGKDGGIEIKCHSNLIYFKLLLGGEIDKKYWWQVQMNLLVSGRKWWDYVGFSPNFKKKLVIIRFYPDQCAFDKLLKGFEMGIKQIESIKKQLK